MAVLRTVLETLRGARLWAVVAAVLAVVLVAVGAMSWVTVADRDNALADARASLSAQQSAHLAGDAKSAALAACVASMKADQADLLTLREDMVSLDRRLSGSGDWEVARLAYQTALEKAVSDFYASWLDTIKGDQVAFKRDYTSAQMSWDRLEDLRESFQSLSGSITTDRSDAAAAYATLESRLPVTDAACRKALDLGASPSPSAAG